VQLTPKKIKLAAGNDTLAVLWSDGHESALAYSYLRERCPCATCGEKGGVQNPAPGSLPLLDHAVPRPERAELVGRYALQIFWSDGHSTGIYSFEYLRSLCNCAQCSSARQGQTK
jgi:DUF971 family protein